MGKINKGFSLIELVITLAMLLIMVAGILAWINPLKRINQAKDTKVKSDIDQIASSLQHYFALSLTYPVNPSTELITSGDLRTYPIPPDGGSYSYLRNASCPNTGCEVCVYGSLYDPSNPALRTQDPVWCWRSASGALSEMPRVNCTP